MNHAQEQLNQLMIFHIHKELTDNLKMKDIANEFISMNDRRMHIFAKLIHLVCHISSCIKCIVCHECTNLFKY